MEIERRFLVAGQAWRQHCLWQRRLQQGYLLAAADGLTLRVRTAEPLGPAAQGGLEAHLTLKAPPPEGSTTAALCRLEFEYPIPSSDAQALLGLCTTRLSKCRYGLDLPGGAWVLDVFDAENAPLVVAEVELERADQAVRVPPWCVRELTGFHTLSNAALARHPLGRWSEAEREQLLGPVVAAELD